MKKTTRIFEFACVYLLLVSPFLNVEADEKPCVILLHKITSTGYWLLGGDEILSHLRTFKARMEFFLDGELTNGVTVFRLEAVAKILRQRAKRGIAIDHENLKAMEANVSQIKRDSELLVRSYIRVNALIDKLESDSKKLDSIRKLLWADSIGSYLDADLKYFAEMHRLLDKLLENFKMISAIELSLSSKEGEPIETIKVKDERLEALQETEELLKNNAIRELEIAMRKKDMPSVYRLSGILLGAAFQCSGVAIFSVLY